MARLFLLLCLFFTGAHAEGETNKDGFVGLRGNDLYVEAPEGGRVIVGGVDVQELLARVLLLEQAHSTTTTATTTSTTATTATTTSTSTTTTTTTTEAPAPNRVAVIGGDLTSSSGSSGPSQNTAELIGSEEDFAHAWVKLSGVTNAKRQKPVCGTLNNGKDVLVCGGDSRTGTASCEVLNLKNQTFTSVPWPMNEGRIWAGSVTLPDGRILAIGGYAGSRTQTVEAFDPKTQSWSYLAPLPAVGRTTPGTVLWLGRVVVIGGSNGNYLDTCLQYNISSDTWSDFPTLNTRRAATAAAVLDNKIYVAGGSSSTDVFLDTVEVFSQDTWKWEVMTSRLNGGRSNHAMATLGNRLIVAGGHKPGVYVSSAEEYDPSTDKWSVIDSMAVVRNDHCAVTVHV